MKRLVWIVSIALVVALYDAPAYAQQQQPRLRYSLWSSEIGMDLQVTSGTKYGTKFNLNELGMDKKETIEVWELEMWQGSLRLDLSYWENKWGGAAQLCRDIDYEGITYHVSDTVDSMFKMQVTDISFVTGLSGGTQSRLSFVGGLKYIEYYSKLWNVTTGELGSEQVFAPVPYIGLAVEFAAGEQTIVGGRFVIFQYNYSGTHVHLTNFHQVDAYIEFRAGTSFALRIGFHNMQISYEDKTADDRFKITQMLRGNSVGMYVTLGQ